MERMWKDEASLVHIESVYNVTYCDLIHEYFGVVMTGVSVANLSTDEAYGENNRTIELNVVQDYPNVLCNNPKWQIHFL